MVSQPFEIEISLDSDPCFISDLPRVPGLDECHPGGIDHLVSQTNAHLKVQVIHSGIGVIEKRRFMRESKPK